MATFLEICQDTARESGTISGVSPSTTTGQSGRLAKVVNWVAEAWLRIQNHRDDWLWMRGEFSKPTIAGTSAYTGASWSITDLARFVVDQDSIGYFPVTLYKTATGVADEGPISYIPYPTYRSRYGRGAQTNNRPVEYSIGPAGQFLLGPIPDDDYTVRGEYFKTPQRFAADSDVPTGLPARFHEIITWRALMLLAEHDEAITSITTAANNYSEILNQLENDQLPRITLGGGPLA